MIILGLWLAACGTVAEPRPTFAPTNTALPRVANMDDDAPEPDDMTEEAVAAQPSPTATPEPTDVPQATPTNTPDPTPEPTAEPTTEPTEPTEPAEEGGAVTVNGLTGDPEIGEIWFNGAVTVNYNNVDWQCNTCHQVAEPLPGSGPYLYGIANEAGERTDQTAVQYLYDSIMMPNAHIAPPQTNPDGDEITWEAGVMPDNWDTVMDEQAVVDIVAYLMTLDHSE